MNYIKDLQAQNADLRSLPGGPACPGVQPAREK